MHHWTKNQWQGDSGYGCISIDNNGILFHLSNCVNLKINNN